MTQWLARDATVHPPCIDCDIYQGKQSAARRDYSISDAGDSSRKTASKSGKYREIFGTVLCVLEVFCDCSQQFDNGWVLIEETVVDLICLVFEETIKLKSQFHKKYGILPKQRSMMDN